MMSLSNFYLWSPGRRSALAALLIVLLAAGLYLLGNVWKRALQQAVFIVPFVALWILGFNIRSKCLRLMCFGFAWIGFIALGLDAAVRGFLSHAYDAAPMSTFILESAANTNPDEAFGFIYSESAGILLWSGVFIAAMGVIAALQVWASKATPLLGIGLWSWRFCLVLFAAAAVLSWAKPSWRIHYPTVFWCEWVAAVEGMKAHWAQTERNELEERKEAVSLLEDTATAPRTIVLVVGESMSRDALSLYGYTRETTPELENINKSDKRFAYMAKAWSVDSATVPAFRSMFTIPVKGDKNVPDGRVNLFALFACAGWSIHWISNQDDLAIQSDYAAFSSKSEFINRVPGRSSVSMDANVLPEFESALSDPAERKLIVVHLIGAHPHYVLRSDPQTRVDWGEDAVMKRLEALDRSPWVKTARDQYDWAMRYQDSILKAILDYTREAQKHSGKPLDWIYLSDHGQELGNTADRLGHSPKAISSYRIPMLLWSSDRDFDRISERPFRSDYLSPFLLELAGIDWKGEDPRTVLIDDRYRWQKPNLPVEDPQMPQTNP